MSLKQEALNLSVRMLKAGIRMIGGNKATSISAQLAEDLIPVISQKTDMGTIKFFCPGRIPDFRAKTLLTKEPETIAWINTFAEGDVFWDVGANVGVYTLYAALRNSVCFSFEPSPGNYYLLNRNIEINKMDDRVFALCIAFNDDTRMDSLYMSNTEIGGALSSFAEAIDWKGKHFTASFKQAMIGFSIDDFIAQFRPLFPNHIKIDVDGIENKIIKGAAKTLSDRRLKSILIELDSSREDYCREVVEAIEKAGMTFKEKKHAPMFDRGDYSDGYNYIFVR
jgi:FkbM family methyltransferase